MNQQVFHNGFFRTNSAKADWLHTIIGKPDAKYKEAFMRVIHL